MAFTKEVLKVKITLTERLLGTIPASEPFKEHVQREAKNAGLEVDDEVETVQEIEEKRWTRFHKDGKGIILYDYVIKGFLKSALAFLQENGGVKKIPAYKHRIDNFIFVYPRQIFIKKKEDGVLERPLRAMTPKGPRVSLSRSDYVEAGTSMECEIHLYKNKEITLDTIKKCLDYGTLKGLGQWNSGGWGRFTYKTK